MQSPHPGAGGAFPLAIEGELTIYRAAELKAVLLSVINTHPAVEVNLSAVSETDTAGVQLLMLAKRHAQQRGVRLSLCAHSPAVVDAFELLDLAAFFGDPLVVPAVPAVPAVPSAMA